MGASKGLQTLQSMSLQTRISPSEVQWELGGDCRCELLGSYRCSCWVPSNHGLAHGVGRGRGNLKECWGLHFLKQGFPSCGPWTRGISVTGNLANSNSQADPKPAETQE